MLAELYVACLLLAPRVHRSARHASGEAANVILKGVVVLLQFVVVGFDILDLFDQGVEPGLKLFGLAVVDVSFKVLCIAFLGTWDWDVRSAYFWMAKRDPMIMRPVSAVLRFGLMARASLGGNDSSFSSMLG